MFAFGSPAGAVPTTLFFDGPVDGGVNKGTASAPAGVPLIQPEFFLTTDTLEVISQSADGTVLPSDPGPNYEITSKWVVKNVSGDDIVGDTYLFFPSAGNRTVTTSQGTTADTTYPLFDPTSGDPPALGLTLDDALGGVVGQTTDAGLGDLFYAGILLKSGTFLADEEVMIDVTYFLTDPQLFPDGSDLIVGLPQLRILMGFVVPEPGTGLLVGFGLLLLGTRRARA